VHGEENDAGGEGFSTFDLGGEVVKRGDVNAAEAQAFGGEIEDGTPKFLARVRQGNDDERAGAEGADGLWILIKASAGHEAIVV
jgi:hypothetical protein